MSVLQIEMNMEASRQARLAATKDLEEREMLGDLFDAQRKAAQGRIEALVAEDKRKLSVKVGKFVKHKKIADKVEDFSLIGSILDKGSSAVSSKTHTSLQSDGVPKNKQPDNQSVSPLDFMATQIQVTDENNVTVNASNAPLGKTV